VICNLVNRKSQRKWRAGPTNPLPSTIIFLV